MAKANRFRITGGIHKGRILKGPANIKTRPMQGFLREALFSMIQSRVIDASALDLFSGTGSIGLEALSRGASSCVFFESYTPAFQVLIQNLKDIGCLSSSRVFKQNLLKTKAFPQSGFEPYDLIFLDPPFAFHDAETKRNLDPLIQTLDKNCFMAESPLLTLQIRKGQTPPPSLGRLTLSKVREHGSVTLNFYE